MTIVGSSMVGVGWSMLGAPICGQVWLPYGMARLTKQRSASRVQTRSASSADHWLDHGLVAMIHLAALPGAPGFGKRGGLGKSRGSIAKTVDSIALRAADEAELLLECGFDALIIENMHDAPYVHSGVGGAHGPETVAAMTTCALAVRAVIGDRLPLGIQVLSGGNREALGIAKATGLKFIRCENFVFSHVADEGLLAQAEAGPLLRYRAAIGAEDVQIFCDLKKKHASHALTADISLADAAEGATFFGADGLIVTGTATGRPTDPGEIKEVRQASDLPVLVGSGVDPESVGELFSAGADALIVGSFIKTDGQWFNGPDRRRCQKLVAAAREARRKLNDARTRGA